jgi:hypothetical protein
MRQQTHLRPKTSEGGTTERKRPRGRHHRLWTHGDELSELGCAGAAAAAAAAHLAEERKPKQTETEKRREEKEKQVSQS